jgi:protein-disulfide isomerase
VSANVTVSASVNVTVRARVAQVAQVASIASVAMALLALLGCGGPPASDPSAAQGAEGDITLPGVDTSEFTPREKHEFTRYVGEFAAPCPAVAVSVGQCVSEKRDCAACLPAAQMIAKGVREGMAREQIADLYKDRFDAASVKAIPLDGSPSRGPEAAPVTLVEFADFECPFCQRIAPELDALWEKRKDKVRFVYKFMPLSMHPHGEIAARAAIAAANQGKFWEMHHQLFASGDRLDGTDLQGYAKALGLDVARFQADLQAPATTARIEADRKLADALGVKGTPTLYIDGREFNMKVDLSDWIDQEIAARSGPYAR